MNMQWNPYFIQKTNYPQLDTSSTIIQNVSFMKFDENTLPSNYNKPIAQQKKIQIQPPSVAQPENIKYKRNKKQSSCIPFQMNIPQQTSSKALTRVAQLSLKPIFNIPKNQETGDNLKGSAVWERNDLKNQQITFESFLKEQNMSRNNSIDHQKTHFKKNTRQYSHVVQGNSGAYFMISNMPSSSNHNTNTTHSYYSGCEKQVQQLQSCNSQRGETKKVEKIVVPKISMPDNSINQLSDRTIKKQSPTNNLLKHKKNTRCISMGEQKQLGLNLECDESSITILSDNANSIISNNTTSNNRTFNNELKDSQIGGYTQETLQALMLQEIDYAPNSDYMTTQQTQINPLMRAILMDWMIEVCSEFFMKRDTFYLAVAYVDSYLSKKTIHKSELQLVGTASMLMASKMEEVVAKNPEDFERATNYGYTLQRIYEMEKDICKVLQWHLNLPTINLWIEFYTNQWDAFISDNNKKFRHNTTPSYKLILKLQSFIDCCYLDIETLTFKPRTIVAAFMYLTLAMEYEQFTKEYIYFEMSKTSRFILVDSQKPFNKLFTEFVQFSFGFNLVDLIDVIKYASKYVMLEIKFCHTLPNNSNVQYQQYMQRHEDLLIYQQYNLSALSYIKNKCQK